MLDMPALISECAPQVDRSVMNAIVLTESGGNPFSLVDAGPADRPWSYRRNHVRNIRPRDLADAEAKALELIARGHIVAMGLAQVTSTNAARFGLSIAQSFDPCVNLGAGARIFAAARSSAPTLEAALSAYNTGNFTDGIANGYADLVLARLGNPPAARAPGGRDPYTAPLEVPE